MGTVDSTQLWARDHVDELSDMTVVLAVEQLKGRGRYGRQWNSGVGGLWATWVLKKRIDVDKLPYLALFVGYHIHQMMCKKYIGVSIKYPNDIMYRNKKLAGILCASSIKGDNHCFSLVGVGMNIANQPPSEGVSLSSIYSKNIHFETVLENVWKAVENSRDHLAISSPVEIVNLLRSIDCKNLPLDNFFQKG